MVASLLNPHEYLSIVMAFSHLCSCRVSGERANKCDRKEILKQRGLKHRLFEVRKMLGEHRV